MFCPECGKPMAIGAARNETADQATDTMATSAGAGPQAATVSPVTKAPPATTVPEPTRKPEVQPNEPGAHPGARERTREKLHRASTAARGAIGDNVKRVEKIHHVSSVMFEEAHYDPSLRFVLVALGLFVVFVVLLVLSKVMG
jgi:hypothetical protein